VHIQGGRLNGTGFIKALATVEGSPQGRRLAFLFFPFVRTSIPRRVDPDDRRQSCRSSVRAIRIEANRNQADSSEPIDQEDRGIQSRDIARSRGKAYLDWPRRAFQAHPASGRTKVCSLSYSAPKSSDRTVRDAYSSRARVGPSTIPRVTH